MSGDALLEMRGVTVQFGSFRALDGVDFDLRAGEIHCLMGENGAGKSTLIKVLTGVQRPLSGSIKLNAKSFVPRSPLHAQLGGVSTVYQEVNLVPQLSVAENICLGREPRNIAGMISWRGVRRRARAALDRLGLNVDVRSQLGSHSIAIQQMVAIARGLDIEAKVLVLDEPTSSLDEGEVQRLFAVMMRLRTQGLAIVFITHFLDQVYAVADRITVLRNGRLIGTWNADALPRQELVARMLGRISLEERASEESADGSAAKQNGTADESVPLVELRGAARRKKLQPISFKVRAGEILGLAGLLGSGRTEVARMIFGIDPATHGDIFVSGRKRRISAPRAAARLGLAYSSEDRKSEGILPSLSVRENVALALQTRRGAWRRLRTQHLNSLVEKYISSMRIAAPSAEVSVGRLSGGNQQKVILARWLAANPRLLILDEPTRGIDVGAKAEIERLIAELSREGMGVIFISSELDEVIRNSTRVAVMRERLMVAELRGSDIQSNTIMQLMAGTAESSAKLDSGSERSA